MNTNGLSLEKQKEPLVSPELGWVSFDAKKSLWLWGMLAAGLYGISSMSATTAALSIGLAFITFCFGHTVGLHRGIIHQTYETHPAVRGFFAWLFVLTGMGGPLTWAKLHATRDYWQNQSSCPRYFGYRHSIARDCIWNLHFSFHATDDRALRRLPPKVLNDPWLKFLEHTWRWHVAVLALALYFALGLEAACLVVCARTAAGIIGHWAIGYAAHVYGERRFVVEGAQESGTNIWTLGLVSFGEGYHNNHHAHPGSARIGMRWYELDIGWIAIWLLERLKVLRNVQAWHRDLPAQRQG